MISVNSASTKKMIFFKLQMKLMKMSGMNTYLVITVGLSLFGVSAFNVSLVRTMIFAKVAFLIILVCFDEYLKKKSYESAEDGKKIHPP